MRSSQTVVIGAGIVGSAAAYYLAKIGMEVTLIDRAGTVGSGGASQACAGGVRHQGRAPVEMPLAIHAIRFWRTLGEELDRDLHYRQEGMTIVTDEEAFIPRLEQRVAVEQSLGLDIRMVYGKDLAELVPGLSPRMLAGSYCPVDGHADPLRSVNALAAAARRRGARVAWNCPAEALLIERGRIAGVRTPHGDLYCERAVLAAGAWSRTLAATAGVHLPFEPIPLQMMVTARRPHALDQVLGWLGHGISLKQVPAGGFVIGGGWPGWGDLAGASTRLLPGSMAKSARTVVDTFPALAEVPVIRAWAGIEAFSADEMQVVGPAPGIEGLFIAAGFSGHGFALGPAVGSLIAEYLVSGIVSELLQPFPLQRFGPAQTQEANEID